jgi:hypothetical protein
MTSVLREQGMTGGNGYMKKVVAGAAIAGALTFGGLTFVASPVQANTTCTHTIGWFKQDANRIGGPDLTAALEAGILAKTGKASLYDVLWAPSGGSGDLIAAKQLIAAASNGAPGDSGFTGPVGDAFYALVNYFEGGPSLTKQQLTSLATVLDQYNNGLRGLPHCDDVNGNPDV